MIVVLWLAGRGAAGEAADSLCVHPGRILLEYASSARRVMVVEADGVAPGPAGQSTVVFRVASAEQAVRVARALIARPAAAISPESRAAARRIPRAGRGHGCKRD